MMLTSSLMYLTSVFSSAISFSHSAISLLLLLEIDLLFEKIVENQLFFYKEAVVEIRKGILGVDNKTAFHSFQAFLNIVFPMI